MSKFGSAQVAFLLVDGYSILGSQTEFSEKIEAVTDEVTALGDAWEAHAMVGVKKGTFAQKGFYDDAALSNNVALVSNQGVSRIVNYGLAGNTVGKGLTGFVGAMEMDYERVASRGKLHLANANFTGSGQANANGLILHALGAETANGNTQSTYVDGLAASSTGAVGYLQVTALTLSGYTSVTMTLQDSADHITWADIASGVFTTVTAAPAAQALVVPGTIRRYLAIKWAFVGAGVGPSVSFMGGIART